MIRLTTLAAAAGLLLAAAPALAAGWSVQSDESRLSFVSIKAETLAEVHHFTRLEGMVSESGEANIIVPLDAVETNADIRNERMREFLFETVKFPNATATASIDMASYEGMKVGERRKVRLPMTIDMHGNTLDIEPEVFVTRAAEDAVSVETVDPIIIEAFDFEMESGIDKLAELAGLPSITPAVPVTFSLLLKKD